MATATISLKQEQKLKSLGTKNYPISKISEGRRTVKINEVLPFKIRFTNIMVPGYSASNPAPIGIAIIGLNNYIL
jgi:hypothetical protein